MKMSDKQIAVIGLDYSGMPLVVDFGKIWPGIDFDINSERIVELRVERDRTLEAGA